MRDHSVHDGLPACRRPSVPSVSHLWPTDVTVSLLWRPFLAAGRLGLETWGSPSVHRLVDILDFPQSNGPEQQA